MFVRIHSPKNYGNTGSSSGIVEYLEKENLEQELSDRGLFFNQENDSIGSKTVISKIDKNCDRLGKNDARYYMISINPSQEEMKHIAEKVCGRKVSSPEMFTIEEKRLFENELKQYSRNVMEKYAEGFNKDLKGDDILYYGKVEHERKYSRFDEQVLSGTKMAGDLKEGFQSHVHIVVSRKDITNKKKLSPFANHKNSKNLLNGKEVQVGFHRKEFVQKCEAEFDKYFVYDRKMVNSFQYRYSMKNASADIARTLGRQAVNHLVPGYRLVNTVNYASKGLSSDDPLQNLQTVFWQNKQSANVMKAMKALSSPQDLVIEATKKLASHVISASTFKI